MKGTRKLLMLALSLSFASALHAQDHHNAWFRGALSLPVSHKFKLDNEVQHRRQNGAENSNLLDKNLMYTYRSWVHYQHSEDVKFSVSPFAYFANYKIIQKPTDESVAPSNEVRFSAAMELQHQLLKKLYVLDRNAVEYRIFQNGQPDITRFRTKLGLRYEFSSHLKLTAFDELFLNMSGTSVSNFFDQKRLGLDLECSITSALKCDVGYLHLTRKPLVPVEGLTKIKEHNVFLNFTYQLPMLLRHRKAHLAG